MRKEIMIDGVNFYLEGMRLYQRVGESEPELIRDFSEDFPEANELHHDAEGEHLNDRDRWSFFAVDGNGSFHIAYYFFVYTISEDSFQGKKINLSSCTLHCE